MRYPIKRKLEQLGVALVGVGLGALLAMVTPWALLARAMMGHS